MASPTINQIAEIANEINKEAYGSSANAINASNFVSVAQTQLLQNYDVLTSAISQVLSKTVFSIRAYDGAFKGLQKDAIKWGNHVRKINYLSLDLADNDEFKNKTSEMGGVQATNGAVLDGVDPWKIRPQGVVQTNFYDGSTYSTWGTFWKDQLDQAFSGVEEFGSYVAGQMNERRNELVSTRENLARTALLNLIGGVVWSEKSDNAETSLGVGKNNVIHLLTEYNKETGQELTKTTIYTAENFKNFMQWVFAKLSTTIRLMEFRSGLYHFDVLSSADTSGESHVYTLKRHTPRSNLHMYMLTDFINKSETMALANTFHDDYLKNVGDYETVPFWQTPLAPSSINISCKVLGKTSGATIAEELKTVTTATDDVVGVLFDDDAIGITQMNQWQASTPMNARGGYSNYFWHETSRYWNDFTENVVVLMLD